MNLWHQQLTILGAKVLAVLAGLAIAGYFLYYTFYLKQDILINYVPQQAIFYATMQIKPDLEQNQLLAKIQTQLTSDYSLPPLDSGVLNQLAGNNLSLAIIPRNNSLEFDYLGLANIDPLKIVPASELDQLSQRGWKSYLITNKIKSRQILAISNSDDVIKQVKQLETKNVSSLGQNIGVTYNLKKFATNSFSGRVYLDLNYFKDKLDKTNDSRLKLLLAAMLGKGDDKVWAGIQVNGNNLVIQNNTEALDADKINQAVTTLPNTTSYSLVLSDLGASWSQVVSALKQSDPDSWSKLNSNLGFWENYYKFTLQADIINTLDNNPLQLIKTNNNEWLAAMKFKQPLTKEQLNHLELLITNYLAQNNQIEKSKELPDHTFITQIVRDTASITTAEDQVANMKIKVISSKTQYLDYILTENNLILANNKDIITNMLQNDENIKHWQEKGYLSDFGANISQSAYINSQNISDLGQIAKYFLKSIFLESSDSKFFWLILD